jgi:hypothetical protein
MSDARTSPPPQARYAVSAARDLRGVPKVYGSGPAEVHAPRQAAAPYAGGRCRQQPAGLQRHSQSRA